MRFRASIPAAVTVLVASVALAGCWSQFRGDPAHTGVQAHESTLVPANVFALHQIWSATPGAGASAASPAVFGDVYAASTDGRLVAYDPHSGAPLWSAAATGPIDSSPAATKDEVWVGTADGSIDAFSAADGTLRWSDHTGGAVRSSPGLSGANVYVGSDDGSVDALNASTGALVWRDVTGGAVSSSPAVANGVVYVGSGDGRVDALDASNGALLWSERTGGPVTSSPSVVNGVVYVGSGDDDVYAFNATTGATMWSRATGGVVSSSPAVSNGVVYVGSADQSVYALDAATGAPVWNAATFGAVTSSPAVANGVVYVGSDDGALRAFDGTSGQLLWSAVVGGAATSPAVASGFVYVTARGGSLRAFSVPAGCAPPFVPVACENTFPGTPSSVWDVSGSGDPSIQGFATDMSVNRGTTVHFKVNTPATAYHLDIYRLGYYGGNGARLMATVRPSAALPQLQPACGTSSGVVDCGNWRESASWAVPPNAVSGIYLARLVRDDVAGAASHVVFVVRDDTSRSNILFQTSDSTWQAYNEYGSASFYGGLGEYTEKASYNRPFTTRANRAYSWLFNAEYPMVRWLEANGYDLSYAASVDTERAGLRVFNHHVFLSVGHDEYWSNVQRAVVTAARDAGVNIGFLSGNVGFWKTRWEPSYDGTNTPYRTLVCYKESAWNADNDPSSVWTGLWRDPRFSPPKDGGRPENALNGAAWGDERDGAITVTAEEGKLRLWRDTSLARLAPGTVAALSTGTLGYEYDWDLDNGARPNGLAILSTTLTPTLPHHVVLYRAASGALVFDAGTVQWSWGLDGHHDRGPSTPDPRLEQATVNALADLGAQPRTLAAGLVAEQPSGDTTPPSTSITTSHAGTAIPVGTSVTVSGTAADRGGGAVAAVEVSVDNGATWHPAVGRSSWSYTWNPTTFGAVTIEARSVDDSGNLGAATVAGGPTIVARACPCSLWDPAVSPAQADNGATNAMEVGVKFRSDTSGLITGIRFYKSAANTGTHVGNLWDTGGHLLGTAVFTNETAAGWQTVSFPQPIPIAAGTVYVASYHTNTGHVAQDALYFDDWYLSNTRGLDVPPLHALWSRDPAGPNGVERDGASGMPVGAGAPSFYFDSFNYWVDVVFAPTGAGTQPVTPIAPPSTPPTGSQADRRPLSHALLVLQQELLGRGAP